MNESSETLVEVEGDLPPMKAKRHKIPRDKNGKLDLPYPSFDNHGLKSK